MLDLRHLKNDVGSTTSGGAYLRDAIDAAINGPCASRQLSAGPNKGPRLPPPGQAIGLKISSVQKKMGVATLRLVKALSSVADRIRFHCSMVDQSISWASRLQSHTSTSTMEAETSAACDAAKGNARDLCYEMGSQQDDVRMYAGKLVNCYFRFYPQGGK